MSDITLIRKKAISLINSGISVIPVKGDTVELIDHKKKPSLSTWDAYQAKIMSANHVDKLFLENNFMGVVCGKISKNLECLDFDNKLGNIDEIFKEFIEFDDVRLIIETYNLYIEKTITGGRHLCWHNEEPKGAGTHIAMQMDEEKGKPICVIETRGEGQYFIGAPSNNYVQTFPIEGSLENCGTINDDERQCLLDIAASFGNVIEDKKTIVVPISRKKETGVSANEDLKPGDDFNSRPDTIFEVEKMLEGEGWQKSKRNHKQWIRPGKTESGGIGGTLGTIKDHENSFYVFTPNAPPLEERKLYNPFALMTYLHFDGDWKECAKVLRERGYGTNFKPKSNGNDDRDIDWKQVMKIAFDIVKKTEQNNDYTEGDVDLLTKETGITHDEAVKILKKKFEEYPHLKGHEGMTSVFEKVKSYLTAFYNIRRNVVKGDIKILPKKPATTADDEINIDTLYIKLQEENYKIKKEDLRSLLNSSFVKDYNELEEYFLNLPQWDESGNDYIKIFGDSFQCYDQSVQEFYITMLKKHLVRSVRCVLSSIENRIIFVFGGEQETGKTTMIRHLEPISDYFIEADPMLMQQKDMQVAMGEHFIWNIEEIDSYSKKEVSLLKQMISKGSERLRKVHRMDFQNQLRNASFFATTNKKNFLTDETGNTRFLVFDGKVVNYNYHNTRTKKGKAPTDMIWAQAYFLYQNGYECDLTTEEKIMRDSMNLNYEVRNDIESLIMQHFDAVPIKNEKNEDVNKHLFWASAMLSTFLQEQAPRLKNINDPAYINAAFIRINRNFRLKNKINEFGRPLEFIDGEQNMMHGRYLFAKTDAARTKFQSAFSSQSDSTPPNFYEPKSENQSDYHQEELPF